MARAVNRELDRANTSPYQPGAAGTPYVTTRPVSTSQQTAQPRGAGPSPFDASTQTGTFPTTAQTGASTGRSGDYAGFGQAWLASGGKTPGELANFIAANPEYGATIGGSKGDKITVGGRTFDAVIAAGLGGTGASWSDITSGGGGGGTAAGGGWLGSGAYVPGQGVPGQGTVFGEGQGFNPRINALDELLMRRSTQDLTPDATDPIIKGQVEAFNAQQQQAQRNYLAGLAERGGPNTNIGAETRRSAEQVGQATGGFEAQLMQQELNARRNEIQQALSGRMGLLTTQQQMQLQEELAQLGLAQNAYQSDQQMQFMNSPLYGG